MTKVYGDILDRMENNNVKGQVEEWPDLWPDLWPNPGLPELLTVIHECMMFCAVFWYFFLQQVILEGLSLPQAALLPG